MNAKNFLIAGIIGGIVDFMLGGLFYQVIFPDLYPPSPNFNMSFIVLGCLTFGMMVSYVFVKWANIKTAAAGLMGGGVLGLFYGLSMDFFMYSGMQMDTQKFVTDVIVNVIMGAVVGAVIGLVNGKMK